MNFILKRSDWLTTSHSSHVVIGANTLPLEDLENYYIGIHSYHTFYSRAARYLCSVGIDAVMKMPVYKCQSEMDRVFFQAVSASCENFLIQWVSDWKEVYKQLGHSRAPFRELIISKGELPLTGKECKAVYKETRKISRFFVLLNMPGAVQMMLDFADSILWRTQNYKRLPEVHPFALKGKVVDLIPAPPQQSKVSA